MVRRTARGSRTLTAAGLSRGPLPVGLERHAFSRPGGRTRTCTATPYQSVSSTTWIPLALAAVCGAAIALFFVRHALAWRKVLVRGEQFLVKHPFFDVFLMSAAVLAFLLSHAAGNIL